MGVQMKRVRVVSVPMNDYVQWELEIHRRSAQKGDAIKIIPMPAPQLELRRYRFVIMCI